PVTMLLSHLLFLYSYAPPRALYSFPTRRSSDLHAQDLLLLPEALLEGGRGGSNRLQAVAARPHLVRLLEVLERPDGAGAGAVDRRHQILRLGSIHITVADAVAGVRERKSTRLNS